MTSKNCAVTTSFIQSVEEGRDEDISVSTLSTRRKSSRIFTAVRNAVIATRQNISNTLPSSGSGTPAMRSKRSHSTGSQLGRDRVLTPSNHDPSCTCSSCNGWMEDKPTPKEDFTSSQNEDICLISDGPFWVFKVQIGPGKSINVNYVIRLTTYMSK